MMYCYQRLLPHPCMSLLLLTSIPGMDVATVVIPATVSSPHHDAGAKKVTPGLPAEDMA